MACCSPGDERGDWKDADERQVLGMLCNRIGRDCIRQLLKKGMEKEPMS
jgi:hypothetical protein